MDSSIAKADQAVSFTSADPSPVNVGDTYTPTAAATSGLAATFSIDASSAGVCSIDGLGVVTFDSAPGTCILHADQAGDDNWNAAPQASLEIGIGNARPVCAPASPVTVRMNVAKTGSGGCTDPESDPMTYAIGTQGTHGTATIDASGTWTYTPDSNVTGVTDSFTVTANDGLLDADPATVNVTIANDPVQGTLHIHSVTATTTTALDVLAYVSAGASDAGQALSVTAVTQGLMGKVTTDGHAITYDPRGCTSGNDLFTFTASDGVSSAVVTAVVKILRPGEGGLALTPVTDTPTANLLLNGTLGATVPVKVAWCGVTKAGVALRGYRVDLSTNGGVTYPSAVFNTTTATSSLRQLAPGVNFRWRVLTVDAAGRRSAYKTSPTARARVNQDNGTSLTYAGSWGSTSTTSASGGSMRWSTSTGASVQLTQTMRQFAIVAPKAATYGSFLVKVDGTTVATVSLKATTTVFKRLVYVGAVAAGTHTITLVPVGNGRVYVDAIVTLQ